MLKVLLLFVLLIAGIVVGPMIAGHQGYVLIQTDNYNIETSVTGLAIILILAMVVLFAIEWLLRRIFRTGAHTRGWFVGRKRRRARKQTEQALLKLAEGDYQQVEKLQPFVIEEFQVVSIDEWNQLYKNAPISRCMK